LEAAGQGVASLLDEMGVPCQFCRDGSGKKTRPVIEVRVGAQCGRWGLSVPVPVRQLEPRGWGQAEEWKAMRDRLTLVRGDGSQVWLSPELQLEQGAGLLFNIGERAADRVTGSGCVLGAGEDDDDRRGACVRRSRGHRFDDPGCAGGWSDLPDGAPEGVKRSCR